MNDRLFRNLLNLLLSDAEHRRDEARVGWGWHFRHRGKRSFFIREIKGGFSASPTPERPA